MQNGSYFTVGLISPQDLHPNFAPIEVTRVMQCQSKSGNTTRLQNFYDVNTLKSAGSVTIHYVEGKSIDSMVSIGGDNSSYNSNSKTYRIDNGSVSSRPNGKDYTIKLNGSGGNSNNTIREDKGEVKKTISNGMLIMSLTSEYLLPENLYRYIAKNIESQFEKPTENLDSYDDAKVPNFPVSLKKKNEKLTDMSAFVKLTYDFPTDNSYMKNAWNASTQAEYFGKDGVNKDNNIYNTSVQGENEKYTACAKLYGLGTSEYSKCKNDRKSDSKLGNCKKVNSDEYVCPIKTYTECVKKAGKCYVDNVETDCAAVNAGQCVPKLKEYCEPITATECQIIENGQVVVVRRDTREKIVVAMDELTEKLSEILETIQKDMFERAKAFLDSHIHTAANMDEMVKVAQEEIGFIKAMWCGDDACEEEIKAQTGGVTSRCIPEEQEQISDVCVCCGKPATKMVYWGRAY